MQQRRRLRQLFCIFTICFSIASSQILTLKTGSTTPRALPPGLRRDCRVQTGVLQVLRNSTVADAGAVTVASAHVAPVQCGAAGNAINVDVARSASSAFLAEVHPFAAQNPGQVAAACNSFWSEIDSRLGVTSFDGSQFRSIFEDGLARNDTNMCVCLSAAVNEGNLLMQRLADFARRFECEPQRPRGPPILLLCWAHLHGPLTPALQRLSTVLTL